MKKRAAENQKRREERSICSGKVMPSLLKFHKTQTRKEAKRKTGIDERKRKVLFGS